MARSAGIPAILIEPQLSPRIAEVIAAEFGGGTVLVDPLGDPTEPARSTYEELMRFNARAFAKALGGKSQ
jgi:zinc transport system substrate-binding protein